MKVGTVCVPFDIVTLDERKKQVEQFLKEAGMQEIQFLVFPEFCFTQRTEEAIAAQDGGTGFHKFSEPIPGGDNFNIMAEAAIKHGMTIIYGAFERADEKHMYNNAVVIGPDGKLLGGHRKALLASGEGEDNNGETLEGDVLDWIETPAGKAAIITCYEVYFPEVARVYELKGADFFVYIHADNGEVTREVARVRSRDAYMPLICSCYASTAGAYIFNNEGETVKAVDGPGIVAAKIDFTERSYGQYRWNDDAKVDKRETKWFQRRPELFSILTEKMNLPHPLENQKESE